MNFDVRVHPKACADIEEIHAFLSDRSVAMADHALELIHSAITGLREFPRRFAVAPESAKASIELRHVIVGNYRVIYAIFGNAVSVYRIVHAARLPLNPADFL